jgi:histidinol-phosphatase
VNPEELLGLAHELGDIGDHIAMRHFGGVVPAVAKPDGTPVTAADREIEQAIRSHLAKHRPGDAILGEEQGGVLDAERVTWVIDPIDATKNFMRGIDVFATLVGVVFRGLPVVGVVSAPAMSQRWGAAQGSGAYLNGTSIQVSGIDVLADAHVLHGGLDGHRTLEHGWERLGAIADRAWRTRGFGDFWGHLLVASGKAEGCFEPDLAPWDIVAPACVVMEAGGRVTSWTGESIVHGGSVLSTNGHLHDQLAGMLTS